MANTLQVASPGVNVNNQQVNNNPLVHPGINPNPVSGVNGKQNGDQQQGAGGTGSNAGQPNINFESNFTNFVQRMHEGMALPKELAQLLFSEGMSLQTFGDEELKSLLNQLFTEMEMTDPKDLMQFLSSQSQAQVKFSGELFDGIRNILNQKISLPFKETILNFVKGYNSYASGEHLLAQLDALGDDIESLILPSVREQFTELMSHLDLKAAPGETQKNAQVLNEEIIPFISKYISKTHNYGPVRTAGILFSLYAVKYENGDKSILEKLFAKLSKHGDFRMLFDGEPEEAFKKALNNLKPQDPQSTNFPELFSKLLQKGTDGSTGSESVDRYYQVLNHLLMNESVYMPLLHLLVPFRYQGKNVLSEMWVDPDADRKNPDDIKKQKLFIKFNIQNVGAFELISLVNNGSVNMQVFVPPSLEVKPETISRSLQDILRNNGFRVTSMDIAPKVRDIRVDEVFPEIREKEIGVNVAV